MIGKQRNEFLAEFGRVVSLAKSFPNLRLAAVNGTKRWQLHRFPYVVVYAVEDNALYVLAVGHARRGPRYWLEKAKVERK